MTPAFRKLYLALFVSVVLQLAFLAPVDAAHGSTASSHARRSLSLKKRAAVERQHDNGAYRGGVRKVAKDGLFGGLLGECLTPCLTMLGVAVSKHSVMATSPTNCASDARCSCNSASTRQT